MRSSFFIISGVCIINLQPEDLEKDNLVSLFLDNLRKHNNCKSVVFDLSLFNILNSKIIRQVQTITDSLRLNSIRAIVTGINEKALAVSIHFLPDFSFETSLNIESAIETIKY